MLTAQLNSAGPNQVVVIKGAKVSEWGGRTLSTMGSSSIVLNPDLPVAGRMRTWFDNGGGASVTALSESSQRGAKSFGQPVPVDQRYVLESISDLNLGNRADGKPDYIEVKCVIQMVNSDKMWYAACPDPACTRHKVCSCTFFCMYI